MPFAEKEGRYHALAHSHGAGGNFLPPLSDRAVEFKIPALALQTMVENAVRYGAEARYEPTTVTVSTHETDAAFVVTVRDDGVGFDVSHTPEDDRLHIGIEGTRSRLAAMVGGTLEIESRLGAGTTVTMTIPKEREAETV